MPGAEQTGFSRQAWRRLKKNRRAMAGLVVIVAIAAAAVLAGVISPYEPDKQSLVEATQKPGLKHPLGTDRFGRDIFSRLVHGARVSLKVGLISQSVSMAIGVLLGSLGGYYRGWVDDVIMWLINVVWSFPALLFVIAVTIALGPGINTVYVAVALVSWVGVARIVRGQFFTLRETEYILAARSLGAGDARIIFRHLLPNSLAPIIVVVTLGFAAAIVAEAGLSFLGLGVQPPEASWGSMLRTGYSYFTTAWWMAVFPGVSITGTVLAFNLLGDGLRDALDPRMPISN